MHNALDEQTSPWPVRAVATIATLTVAICAVAMLGAVFGVFVMGPTDAPLGVTAEMHVRGDLVDDVDLDDRLPPRMIDDDGTVTNGGRARVDIAGPTNVGVVMYEPTVSQRVIWLIPHLIGPLLIAAVAWLVRSMARSVLDGDPFTTANEQRLWHIAGLIAVGGTFMAIVDGIVDTLLVQRSAAADLFTVSFDISFVPIVVGLMVGALASIWRVGIGLRDDVAATI